MLGPCVWAGVARSLSRVQRWRLLAAVWLCPGHQVHVVGVFGSRPLCSELPGWWAVGWGDGGVLMGAKSLVSAVCSGSLPWSPCWQGQLGAANMSARTSTAPPSPVLGEALLGHWRPDLLLLLLLLLPLFQSSKGLALGAPS